MEYKYLAPLTDEFGTFIKMEEKKVEIKNDLMETFQEAGRDFLNFFPIDTIEKFFLENKKKIDLQTLSKYMNNIYLHILEDKLGGIEYEGYKTKRNGEYYDNPPKEMRDWEKKIFKSNKEQAIIYHSEKRWNQTQYEVDEECKSATMEAGFNTDNLIKEFYEVKELNNKLYSLDEENDAQEIEKINQFKKDFLLKMVKIYIILRKKGYSSTDIT